MNFDVLYRDTLKPVNLNDFFELCKEHYTCLPMDEKYIIRVYINGTVYDVLY